MKSYVLYKLHSVIRRVIHLALGALSWLKRTTVRAVAFIKNTICMMFLVSLVTGCHMNRHVVTHVDDTGVSQTGHREQAVSSRLDSLFSQLSASADSITLVLYGNAFPSTVPSGFVSATGCGVTSTSTCSATSALHVPAPDTLQSSAPASLPGTAPGTFGGMANHPPAKASITIHSPRINKEVRSGSSSCVATNVVDSTRSNTESHTSTDDSKEVIGGAEPPKLTWVFIVLGLGITLLLIGAVFGYMWLHKKGLL